VNVITEMETGCYISLE